MLEAYLRSLKALKPPPRFTLDFAFVDDNADAASKALLAAFPAKACIAVESRPEGATYAVGAQTHEWAVNTFTHLAQQRQRLLDYAISKEYDYFFSVDSDLLLEPTTLINLLHCNVQVANAVFWTAWQAGAPEMPQVWTRHPYEFDGLGGAPHEFMSALAGRKLVRCIGGGACTLIHCSVLEAGIGYFPLVAGLPQGGMWQGEDRSFAIKCQQRRVRQYACAFSDVYHAYHPADRTPQALQQAWERLRAPRQLFAKYGDWVHFTLEALEDAGFQENSDPTSRSHRGRLGGFKVMPEIEEALLDMSVGEERILELRFPPWYEITDYAGKSKHVLLKLVDVKSA